MRPVFQEFKSWNGLKEWGTVWEIIIQKNHNGPFEDDARKGERIEDLAWKFPGQSSRLSNSSPHLVLEILDHVHAELYQLRRHGIGSRGGSEDGISDLRQGDVIHVC